MTDSSYYRAYVSDETFMTGYAEYQKRYAAEPRESDKAMIARIRRILDGEVRSGRRPALLDVGCSTGNFLRHLKAAAPGIDLTGGDLVPAILEKNRRDPALEGIRFEEVNVLEIGRPAAFDVVVANAVLYLLTNEEFERAVASVAAALKPGGRLIGFDWYIPFEQDLAIVERSETHPDGLSIHARPYAFAERVLRSAGFDDVRFDPFEIPIDLPKPDRPGDMGTYTVRTAAGGRMQFRGALHQPWCFLTAGKACARTGPERAVGLPAT